VSWRRRALVAGVVAGTAAGTAALAYALERAAVRRLRVDEAGLLAAGRSLPTDLEHHFIAVSDGGRIHAVERGEGPPIVLVHGVTLGVATWAPQLHHLAARHRVIAVDQRGHGQSLHGTDGHLLERLADDLIEVLSALEVTGAVLVGHSMGGMVTQLAAVERPEDLKARVAGLVLLATSAGPLFPGAVGPAAPALFAALSAKGLRRSEARGSGLFPSADVGTWASRVMFGARPNPADVELARSMTDAMSPRSLAELVASLSTFDVHTRIAAIDLPTHVVVGSRDVLLAPRWSKAMAAKIPGARLSVFPGCGHMVMLEREDELNALLSEFSGALTER
jgi:non-heme chloroperoxidase